MAAEVVLVSDCMLVPLSNESERVQPSWLMALQVVEREVPG